MHQLPSYSARLATLACATLLTACGGDTPATPTVALPAALLETHD